MVMNKPEEVKHQISPHNTDMENVDDDTDTDTDNDNEAEPSLFDILQDDNKEELDDDLNINHQE